MTIERGRERSFAAAPGSPSGVTPGVLAVFARPAVLLAIYVPLLFLSALLMFWVQPLIGKLILPLLGGTPMVWSTCMVFFQAMLLAGYAYAHVTLRLGVRRQAMLHLVLIALSLTMLPVGQMTGWTPPAIGNPLFWQLTWMAVAVGMPFFVLSATAPMLQAWFARTDHPDARDPYFLYVTSNAGSLIGLLGFPLLVEPLMTLPQQSWTWSGTYIAFGALIVLAALTLRRNGMPRPSDPTPTPAATVAVAESPPPRAATAMPTAALRVRWMLLAFVPSSLLLGITTFVTTDIAAVPLLWIIPLAAYLITFMIAFAKRPLIRHRWALLAQPIAVLPALLLFFWGLHEATYWMMALHFVAFFLTALVCHGELARTRPDSRHLTEFYLLLSFGGVLGGMFNALVAPVLFTTHLEYPLIMVAALLLRPLFGTDSGKARRLDIVIPVLWFAAMLGFARWTQTDVAYDDLALLSTISLVLALVCFVTLSRPIRFGLMTASIVGAGWVVPQFTDNQIYAERNFFGILRVVDDSDNAVRYIYHGTTQHGAQLLTPSLRLRPIAYYVEDSPIAQVFEAAATSRPDGRIAVVGLGAGTLACLGVKGQTMTFYEIDPAVERVARDPNLFTYLRDCPPKSDVVLGDGRLTIANAADRSYDVIALDAFTSDAVPVHLLTVEAARLYRSKLKDDGVIIFNISNRYLDLGPILGVIARAAGMTAFLQEFEPPPEPTANSSSWVVMVAPGPAEARFRADDRWTVIQPRPGLRPWTDSYSNLLSAIMW